MRLVPQVEIYRGETAGVSTQRKIFSGETAEVIMNDLGTRRKTFHGETAEVTKNDAS